MAYFVATMFLHAVPKKASNELKGKPRNSAMFAKRTKLTDGV